MIARERLALSAKTLNPLRQGDLDGLCGLYAAINATQLAAFPRRRLRRTDLVHLFKRGLVELGSTRRLRYIITDGLHDPVFLRMLSAVVSEAERLIGYQFTIVPLFRGDDAVDIRRAMQGIRRSLRLGHPVLIALEGRYNHWTVMARYSSARLTLFDSSGYRWISTKSLAIGDPGALAPHLISPSRIYAVMLGPDNPLRPILGDVSSNS